MKATIVLKLPDGRQVPIKIETTRRQGDWLARAEISTRNGPVVLTAVASEATAKALLQRAGHSVTTGGFFDRVAKFAQSSAVKSVLEGIETLSKNPVLLQAASFYPPAQTALQTVNTIAAAAVAAQNLIARKRGGDPKAHATIAKIVTAAKAGNQPAKKMLGMLRVTNDAVKQQQQRDAMDANFGGRPRLPQPTNDYMLGSWAMPALSSGAEISDFNLARFIETARRFG